MNKLLTKIVGVALGATMAIGVGVGLAVGNKKEVAPVHATSPVTFTTTSGGGFSNDSKTIDGVTLSFDLNGGTWQSGHVRVFKNGGFTISSSTVHLTEIEITCTANYDSNYGPKKINADVGTYTCTSGSAVGIWTGDETTVNFDTNTAQARVSQIVVTYYTPSSGPSIRLSKESLVLNTADTSGKTVTVTPSGMGDGTKHYKWSTDDSSITLTNDETATVTITANTTVAGSAAVDVKVWGGDVAEADALTASVTVTIETPLSVAQALTAIDALEDGAYSETEVYTKGIIIDITEVSTTYYNATYTISDDELGSNELLVFQGKYLNNTDFTSEDQIQVGDTVIVYGKLQKYVKNSVVTPEIAKNNYLVSIKSEPRLSLSPSSVEVTVGTDVEVTAIPSNFDTGTITYSFDEDGCAILSHDGNTISVHGEEIGNHTFTVTGKVGDATQATAELVVSVVAAYPTSISRSGYASFTDSQTFVQGTGSLSITYSDGSKATKHLGDAGVKLYVGGVEVNASSSTAAYKGANSGSKITYTENEHTVETNSYILNVNAELEITSFEGIPSGGYLIIDNSDPLHSATIIVNYKSLIGEPELSIVSSNPSKLIVSYDEDNNIFEDTTGMAQFTITAGNTVGQYSVTASVTYGTRTETKSFSIDVRGEAPTTGGGDYQKVTSLADLATGDYVIAVDAGSVYGMTRSLSGGKYAFSDSLTVTNGKISASDGDDIKYYISISGTGNSRTATIKNPSTNNYVYYSSSSNVAEQSTIYNWTITMGSYGTFDLESGTSGRGLYARTGTQNKFGGYSSGNLNGTEYYNIELFKYVEPAASSFDIISSFVSNYMHMSDVSIGNHNDTGACKGDSGYYLTAKRAWNDMVEAYEGEDDLEDVFETSFEDAYARYMAWADAMNDAGPFDGYDEVHTNIRASAANMFNLNNKSANIAVIVTIISLVALTAVGGYFFIRRKKEN